MQHLILNVNEQQLKAEKVLVLASDIIEEVDCEVRFEDASWFKYDAIKIIFEKPDEENNTVTYGVFLSEDNTCMVPWELLVDVGSISANLVGCDILENNGEVVVRSRLTSFKIKVIKVKQKVNLDGDTNSPTPTPSEIEQLLGLYYD